LTLKIQRLKKPERQLEQLAFFIAL